MVNMPSWWIRVGCSGMLAWAGACGEAPSEPAPSDPPAADAPQQPQEAAPPKVEAPAAPAPIVPSGHGVVRVGGGLYTSASSATPVVIPAVAARPELVGVTIDIVGEEAGRLVVETLGGAADQHHCARDLSGLSDLRLRLYVDPKDLLEITTAPVEHAFADGTKISLSPGVPLSEAGGADPSLRAANARGTLVELPVPEASRGTFHEPASPREQDGALGKIHDGGDPSPPLRYAEGRTLPEDALFRDGGTPSHYGVTSRDGDAFLTVRNACLEAIVRTSTTRLTESGPPRTAGVLGMMAAESGHFLASPYGSAAGAGDEDVWGGLTGTEIGEAYGVGGLGLVGTGRAAAEPTYTARAGAPIHWEDGKVAGQVLAARDFSGASREVDGRRCFDVKLIEREDAALSLCFAAADLEEKAAEETGTIGLGMYGLSGSSGGFGGRGKRVPVVRQSKAEVKGSLDKDIIRRIVRAHINEVRYCYNQLLVKEPTAEGKVKVSFTIGASGKISASSVADNTTGDTKVGECIAKAVKRWTFPKPTGGGVVTVSYPFVLTPGA